MNLKFKSCSQPVFTNNLDANLQTLDYWLMKFGTILLPLLMLGCISSNQYQCCLDHPTATHDLLEMEEQNVDLNCFAIPSLDDLLYWRSIFKHLNMGGVTQMKFFHLVDNKSGDVTHLNNLRISCSKYIQIF